MPIPRKRPRPLYVEQLEPRIALNSYFVSPTGNDNNAGTSAAPWLTLQQAADQVVAGDVVTVEAGTYAGFVLGWNFPQNGTATKPIVFQANAGVIINSRNNQTEDGINLEGTSFITVTGFDVENPSGGTIVRAGIRAVSGGSNAQGVVIENNTVNNCGTWGIFTSHEDGILIQNNVTTNSQSQHGIYVSNASVNPVVKGNTSFGNADAGIQLNGDLSQGGTGLITGALIVGNIIHDNGAGAGGSAINLDGVQSSIIENNLLYNNHASGISLFMIDGAAGSKNNVVVNNTILMASDARWALNIKNGSTGNTIFDNILFNASAEGTINVASDSLTGLTSNFNVVVNLFSPDDGGTFDTLAQWQSQTGQDKNSIISTPSAVFINVPGNNYQELNTSPSVDVGVSQLAGHNAPTVDIVGTTRPQGSAWDIGTYELVAGVPGVATHFRLTAPASTTAGSAFSITVTALDAFNSPAASYLGTVHFTSSDSAAVLPSNYLFVAGDAGVHTFTSGVTLKTAGTKSVAATDTLTGTITGSASLAVNPAAASKLWVSGYPSPTAAGVSHSFTVTAQDAFNNTATGYTGTVHFTTTDGAGILPADYSFVGGDAGVHSFSVTLKTAGSQSITATDTVTGTINGSQTSITVNPAAASKLVASGYPSSTTAGVSHSFTVTALDAFNNTATGYTGTVTFTSTDSQAVLPANYSFVNGDAGVHSFSATLKTAGSQSITVADTVTSSIKGSQTGITVSAATATSKLLISGYSSPTIAGVSHSFTITAQDAFNNTTTGYTGTVHFTSTDGAAVLPADYTFVAGDAGVHTFSATLKTAGTQSITATDTLTSSIKGSQTGIRVNPATAASTFIVSGFTSPTNAGAAHTFTVTAKDAFGNTATGYTGTATFTSSDSKAVLPANYTFVGADAGVHSFSATLKTAGNQSITATDTVSSSIKGTQAGISVLALAANRLIVSGFPPATTAGTPHSLVVTAQDIFGNIATTYSGTIAFSSTDGQAVLPANYTFVVADAGVHSFSATLKTAGSQSITATDTVTGSITGTESGISVSPAAMAGLLVTAPGSVTAGLAFAITVTAVDPFSNVISSYLGTIHFTSSDNQAVLPADYTFLAADSGVHVFTNGVTLKTVGSQTVTTTDAVASSLTGQATITVNSGTLTPALFGRVSSSGQVWGAVSNGTTAFSNSLWASMSTGVTWADVLMGDFNGDGKTDIVARAAESGDVWVGLSNGSMFQFSRWTTWSASVPWVDVRVGDFNGDGKADLAGRVASTGQWWVAQSTGSSFSNRLWTTWSTGTPWTGVSVGDFNGDGKDEIAGLAVANGQWWLAQSTGTTVTNSLWASWSTGVTWVDIQAGDFNGDGKADLTARALQSGQWWTALSTGSSFTTSLWATWSTAVSWVDVKVGDFTGDGKTDIVGRAASLGQWWLGRSTGAAFTSALWATWSTGVTWVDVQVGDFNGDGKADITGRALEIGQWWTGMSNGSVFNTTLWATWSTGVTWSDVRLARNL